MLAFTQSANGNGKREETTSKSRKAAAGQALWATTRNEMTAKMKIQLFFLVSILIYSNTFSQNIIKEDTEINETIRVNDTIDLEFLHGDGFAWWSDTNYDSTLISVKFKSSRLMEGNLPKDGKQIHTIQFKGKKPGKVNLEFYWGRPWLKEKLYTCLIAIQIQ